jgi:hypothetical protein
MKNDTISRQAAINLVESRSYDLSEREDEWAMVHDVEELPPAQPELSTDIQDVLGYLDDVLHPLISPDNWNVYSELHNMVSSLSSAQSDLDTSLYTDGFTDGYKQAQMDAQEIIRCKDCKHWLDIDDGRQKHRMCADVYGNWFCADAERR